MALIEEGGGDAPSDTTTRFVMGLGDVFRGSLPPLPSSVLQIAPGWFVRLGLYTNDADTVRVQLKAGTRYEISVDGVGPNALPDPKLKIYDSNGKRVAFNNDGGPGKNAKLFFTPEVDGTYYIGVTRNRSDSDGFGDYEISFNLATPIPATPYDDIADYIATQRIWRLGPDSTLDVNITKLTADGQQLARWALEAWNHVTGIHFRFVDQNADITFQNGPGAYQSHSYDGSGRISGMTINISTSHLSNPVLGSWVFYAYLHEVGHALGLGHAGPYPKVKFPKDSFQTTVMSYLGQTSQSGTSASFAYPVTPMIADMIAIWKLFGLPATANPGNTIYGHNGNVGGYLGQLFAILTGGPKNADLVIVPSGRGKPDTGS